jgi:hypothetical protein
MTVISNMEKGFINKIDYIILTLEDDTEIRICEINDYDLDLYGGDYSSISFTTVCTNNKLLSRFKRESIKHIHIKFDEINGNDRNSVRPLLLDIPCNMKIKRCRVNGDTSTIGNMYVELEGMVR